MQTIPVLYEHQLSQATELEGSQLIDTYLLQARVDLTRLQLFILDKYNSLVRQIFITLPRH